jgi:inner membrane protein
MPTILTHPAVPLAIGLGLGQRVISRRLLLCGIVGSILPDMDVVAFKIGIPYGDEFGHRGFSHSLLFAGITALLGACGSRWLRSTFLRSFVFLFFAVASHGVLDAFTNGGMGIAFFWPWSEHRHFAPVQVIEVSPLGVSRFLSERGARVLRSELIWIWMPAIALVSAALALRWRKERGRSRRRSANYRPR